MPNAHVLRAHTQTTARCLAVGGCRRQPGARCQYATKRNHYQNNNGKKERA